MKERERERRIFSSEGGKLFWREKKEGERHIEREGERERKRKKWDSCS